MANATQNRHRAQDQIKEGVQNVAEGVQRYASEGVNQVRDTAHDYMDQGRARARELSESVEQQVRDQPMKAILISAAAGFLLGLFMRR